jgi:hypothetical protein
MSWFFKGSNSSSSSRDAVPSSADVLASAQAILKKNGYPFDLLPKLSDDKGWTEIKNDLKMSLAQIMALKKCVESLKKEQIPTNSLPEVVGEDFSSSPVSGLKDCLQYTADVTVLQSLVGPGYCLFNLLPAVEPSTGVDISKALIETVVNSHRQGIVDLAVKPDMDIELLLAIRLYTIQTPIPFFDYVNGVLNSPQRTGFQNIAPFMRLLIKALYAMDDCGYGVTTQAYRGVKIKPGSVLEDKFNKSETVFVPQQLITFAGFTSVTRVASEAQNFGDYFFFHFLSVRGVDISSVSAYPQEMELLVIPPAVFRVGGACKLYGRLTVPLTQVEQENASYLSRSGITAVSKEVCFVTCMDVLNCIGVLGCVVGTGCALQQGQTGQS